MAYGIIEYDDEGKPICEICKKSFNRVISHVRQKHNITEKEYKNKFGFDSKKGICSKESSNISREKIFQNYDKCITKNLIINGEKSRYKKGDEGRTKEMVSEQTRMRLKKRLKDPNMITAMKKSGEMLGKSGMGNAVRWGK